jgi:hypothetical protein
MTDTPVNPSPVEPPPPETPPPWWKRLLCALLRRT